MHELVCNQPLKGRKFQHAKAWVKFENIAPSKIVTKR